MRNHLEDDEQSALFGWAALYPQCRLLYAVPNGGYRKPREAARMKRQGTRAGVPDICLPVARGGFHGLYIEMKRPIVKGEAKPVVSKEQAQWLKDLRAEGYCAEVCYGFNDARDLIENYLLDKVKRYANVG